jgi:hypothetical protein
VQKAKRQTRSQKLQWMLQTNSQQQTLGSGKVCQERYRKQELKLVLQNLLKMHKHLPQIRWVVPGLRTPRPQHQMSVMSPGHRMSMSVRQHQIHCPRQWGYCQRWELKLVLQMQQLRHQKNSPE